MRWLTSTSIVDVEIWLLPRCSVCLMREILLGQPISSRHGTSAMEKWSLDCCAVALPKAQGFKS